MERKAKDESFGSGELVMSKEAGMKDGRHCTGGISGDFLTIGHVVRNTLGRPGLDMWSVSERVVSS